MAKTKICLVFSELRPHHLARIREAAPDAVLVETTRDEARSVLDDAEIAFGLPRPHDVDAARALRWLQLPSAGADAYVGLPAVREGRIAITHASGVFGIPIAEHVVGMVLVLTRRLDACIRSQAAREWKPPAGIDELYGKTAGVIGLGDIGTEVAKRLKAFGVRVLAVKRRPGPVPPYVDALYGGEGIDRVIAASDIVILCLPGTSTTAGLVSRRRIESMKRGALLINIGRGSVVDEPALIEALQSGHLGGAGLDVFAEEPLPKESPLWAMENVVITPHVSGRHPRHADRATDIFCDNLRRYLRGEPLHNLVDVEQGY